MVQQPQVPGKLDEIAVVFDDSRAVSDAGLLLCATLSDRLAVEALVNDTVDLSGRTGGTLPGRKVMTLVDGMLLGADSIDDMHVLRCGRQHVVLGHRVMAPSTLGTFLRAFTFGHVRQLDKVLDICLARAWAAGAGPAEGSRLVVDIDSFIGQVYGVQKHGAAHGYTKKRGYHPMLATRADTGEVLHIRNRKGSANTQRGQERFVQELLARLRRAGHTGEILLRADSGYENREVRDYLCKKGVLFSIAARRHAGVVAAIDTIPETAWTDVEGYPDSGQAQIAETTLGESKERLIVRRVRTLGDSQEQLFDTWKHYAIVTNRTEPLALVEAEHRQHAVVEQTIRDLKDQALRHFPSGHMWANSAWTVIAALAHNIGRWSTLIGLPDQVTPTARTRRTRLLHVPGRLTRHARKWTLHLPTGWPWSTSFTDALQVLRAIPPAT